jgi:hypothetical protein
MKVVINSCYGGFGLSDKAIEMLLDRKGIEWEKDPDGIFYGADYYHAGHVGESNHYISRYNFYDNDRTDKDLIEVIEELGEEANGDHAELTIVEVPDDVKWTIEEYDGQEWVAEVHRRWY